MADASSTRQKRSDRADPGRSGCLNSTLRFIGQHVRGFSGAVVSAFAISFIIALLATVAFILFSQIVLGGWTQAGDDAVLQWFARHRSPLLDSFMREVTALGSIGILAIVASIASVFLWLTHHRWSVLILLAGIIGGWTANSILKIWFERPRPTIVPPLAEVGSLSFPSGHAMTSMIVYGSIAYLLTRFEPTRNIRRATVVATLLLIVLIGISRVYLGVHYPSDVVGGYIAGLAWIGFAASARAALRHFAPRRPRISAEEEKIEEKNPGLQP